MSTNAKRYTLETATGEPQLFAKKDSAIRAGDKIGEAYKVLSPAGAVVHEVSPEHPGTLPSEPEETTTVIGGKADADELALQAEEAEEQDDLDDLIGDLGIPVPAPEAEGSYTFPGNYSISFVKFAQTLADAVGGLETRVEKTSGLARIFHFAGSKEAVANFAELLEDSVPATHAALRTWQKENIESRRGKTDMQKFLEHRAFIEGHAKTIAEQI